MLTVLWELAHQPHHPGVIPLALTLKVFELVYTNSGLPGLKRTLEKLKERAYLPGYKANEKKYVRECLQSQQ